jgi:Ca-activated chloride channel family protein
MILTGLTFAQLATIFACAGLGVAALYLLKLRRRTVPVPFSVLWDRILRDREATTLFSKLKRILSLVLQLALLGLLVLALGNPRLGERILAGRTLVVLVDASASMQATDVRPSRFSVAKDEVRRMVRGLGGGDRMLLARMSADVLALGPLTGDTATLEREVDSLEVTDAAADFPRALRFANDVLRGASGGEIVVVSDGALGPAVDASGAVHVAPARLTFVPVGHSGRNIGITQFSVRRDPLHTSRYEVMLELSNTGPGPEEVELQLLGDGSLVDLTRLRLAPGERLPRFYPLLSGASRTLEAKIALADGTHDELAVDDHAYALLPERQRSRVLVVTEGNTYLEAALLLGEYLDVTDVAPAGYARAMVEGRWDAVIFDRVVPAVPPKASALYLDPAGPGAPVSVSKELWAPSFDKIDRTHPVVRYTALEDVNISVGRKLVPESDDRVVGASEGGASPILVAGTRGGFKFVALGFDVRKSDLPLRPAWPLFVLDCLDWFANEDARYLSAYRTGEVWRVPVGGAPKQALLKLPDGGSERIAVHDGHAVLLGERTGFYSLTTPEAAGSAEAEATTSFAANLVDARESAIAPRDTLVVEGRPAGPLVGFRLGAQRDVWVSLLLVAALLTAIEWATYHRRITV